MATSVPHSALASAQDLASRKFLRFRTSGDPKALGAMFDDTAPDLMALASHFTSDLAAAEDLVQECFLVAMKKAKSWDARRPVVPWLAGILIAEARKQRRRRRRWLDPGRLRMQPAPEGLREALRGELRTAVTGAVEQLPPRYREVVRANLLDDEEPQAIARRLHRAPGTVRVQLHRGLDLLRRALPIGIGLSLFGVLPARGLGEVRRHLISEASRLGPGFAAANTSILTNTGISIMGAKGLATATLAAVCLGVGLYQFGGRVAHEPTPIDTVEPAAAAELEDELATLVETVSREVMNDTAPTEIAAAPIEQELEPVVTSGRVWLSGEIVALQPPPSESFEVEISAGAGLKRKKVESLAGPGQFRVEITDLVGDDDPRALRLLSVTRCPGFIPSSAWCTLTESGAEEGIVYTAKMTPKQVQRRITGRLVTPDGTPIERAIGNKPTEPWVAFLPEVLKEPFEYQHLPWARVEADGTFDLKLTDPSPGAVLYTAAGFSVGRRETASEFASDGDLLEWGDVGLPTGATIEGRAFHQEAPAPKGSLVIATTAYLPTPSTLLTRQLRLHGDRAIHAGVEAVVGNDGRFVLEGLENGVSYGLFVLPGGKGGIWPAVEEGAGMSVTAPASGIELFDDLMTVTLRVKAGEAVATDVRIRAREHKEGDRRSAMPHGLLGGLTAGFAAHGRTEMRLLIAPDRITPLYVSAKGFGEQPLDLDPAKIGPDGVVTVVLGSSAPTARVRVTLEGPNAASMAGWTALLLTYDRSMQPEYLGPVPIQGGVVEFEGVALDLISVRLALQMPPTLALSDLPLCKRGAIELFLPNLEKNELREVALQLPQQGIIELHLVGRDEAVTPTFELVEENGNVARPPIFIESDSGHRQVYDVEDDGPMHLGSTLPPGTYVLRQSAPGYRAGEREVTVLEGQVTLVSFQLEPVEQE